MMKEQLQAKIFLAEERGCIESDYFRTYHTFNFKENFKKHKGAFQGMYLLNEETIAGSSSMNVKVDMTSYVLLLPLVGTILCKINNSVQAIVNPGQLQVFTLSPDTNMELLNCYESELINFIQVWIHADSEATDAINELNTFDTDGDKNKLVIINEPGIDTKAPVVSIGKFMGRKEEIYTMKNNQSCLFIFVIDGAFEVQGRLLHARDGLGIWNNSEGIELEALSNEAIILFIELHE